jgi:hypothetical protein
MRYARRLPPLLRVMNILGLLFILMAVVALLAGAPIFHGSFQWSPMQAHRATGIVFTLLALSLACTFVVSNYTLRFRRAGRPSYPLDSWPSQVRWWLLLGTLPLCVLALAVVLPRTPLFDFVLAVLTVLAMLLNLAAWVYAADKWQALS